MGGGSESDASQEMRKQIRQAVQEAMSETQGRSSPRRGRVAHGGSTSPSVDPEQIRQLVAEEIGAQRQRSPAGSSGGSPAGDSGSSRSQTGWGRFRRRQSPSSAGASASGQSSRPGQAEAQVGTSTEAVAQVLGQAQWELSEDLSANLKELRRVINQSQEIARKIEQVLGQGTSGQGG